MITLLIALGIVGAFISVVQYIVVFICFVMDAEDGVHQYYKVFETKKQFLIWLIPCFCIYWLFSRAIKAFGKSWKELG